MKKKSYSSDILWAGTNASLDLYLSAVDKYSGMTPQAAGFVVETPAAPGEDKLPDLLTVQDGIGIITINGALSNTDNWWNKYEGIIFYGDIQEALYAAAAHPDVNEILLDVHSPGGTVSGAQETAKAVTTVGKQKKITAHADMAASAGYWIYSGAKDKFASPTSIMGSIGVVMKHSEHSKAAEKAGFKETVLRSGKYKQLMNSSEPLTQLAIDEAQGHLDQVYGIFVQDVADNLGVSYQQVDTVAQGREYVGSQAVTAGLVDGIKSFEDVYASMTKRNEGGSTPVKKTYGMAAALAAASAGVGLPVDEEIVEAKGPIDPMEDDDVVVTSADVKTDPPEPIEGEEAAAVLLGKIDLLKAQLAERDEALMDAKIAAKAYAAMPALTAIVAQVVNNMQVGLGAVADESLATLGAEALIERHVAVTERFMNEFKIGGVSASGEETPEPKTKAVVSRIDAARVKLVVPRR